MATDKNEKTKKETAKKPAKTAAKKTTEKKSTVKTVKKADVKKTETKKAAPKKDTAKKSAKTTAVMDTTMGVIEIELYPDKAPLTVKNFIDYVKSGFYDGLIFHRVIPSFMIQGGGFDENMNQKKPKAPIKIESDNGLSNDRGTIAMARTNDPHSATSQFFINVVDNPFLNFREASAQGYGYAVFGKVTKGLDVADKIAAVQTGSHDYFQDVPLEFIIIKSVTLK